MAESTSKSKTGKFLALQTCVTKSAGKMFPKVEDWEGKTVWPGDIAEVDIEEAKLFGPKHLKPQPATAKVRRWKDFQAEQAKAAKKKKSNAADDLED